MDQPTAKIRRRDLRVLVSATRIGVAPAIPVLRVVPETTLPVKPLPLAMPDQPIPINPLTVVLAFVVAMGVGFVATVPFW
jgi:hypothetical protein